MVLTERLERSSPRYEGGVLPDELGQRLIFTSPETSAVVRLYRQRGALCDGRANLKTNARNRTRKSMRER